MFSDKLNAIAVRWKKYIIDIGKDKDYFTWNPAKKPFEQRNIIELIDDVTCNMILLEQILDMILEDIAVFDEFVQFWPRQNMLYGETSDILQLCILKRLNKIKEKHIRVGSYNWLINFLSTHCECHGIYYNPIKYIDFCDIHDYYNLFALYISPLIACLWCFSTEHYKFVKKDDMNWDNGFNRLIEICKCSKCCAHVIKILDESVIKRFVDSLKYTENSDSCNSNIRTFKFAKTIFTKEAESHKKDGQYAKLMLDYILIPDLSNIVHQYAYS
jgi:hypothetical protein